MCKYEQMIFGCAHEDHKKRFAYCDRAREDPRRFCPLETELEIMRSSALCTACSAAAIAEQIQEDKDEDDKTPSSPR